MLACKGIHVHILEWAERPLSEKRAAFAAEKLRSSGFELLWLNVSAKPFHMTISLTDGDCGFTFYSERI